MSTQYAICVSGEEENLFQLSAATINAEWLVDAELTAQACDGQCTPSSCSACEVTETECSEHKPPPEGSNIHKSKVGVKSIAIVCKAVLSNSIPWEQAMCIIFFVPAHH